MKKYARIAALGVAAFLLAGCAGSVKREANLGNDHRVVASKFQGITITLNDNAKSELVENSRFDAERLRSTVQRILEAKGLIVPTADTKINIEITDIRVRSNFTAVMFGFMAGADHIEGKVIPVDRGNKPLDSFDVSASYALGGLGGGQDDARMGWLYDKFAELTVKELSGTTDK